MGFVCVAHKNAPIPKSKYLKSVIILPPEMRFKTEGIKIIEKFLNEFEATGLIAVSEEISCWLYDKRHRLPEKAVLWCNDSNSLRKLIFKENQIALAEEAGFDVLPTHIIRNMNDVELISPGDYPLCLRPSDPWSIKPTFKVQYIEGQESFLEFVAKLEKIEKPIVAQPFLVLPNLNIHASRSADGELHGPQSFIVKRKFKGVSLTFQPYNLDLGFYEKCSLLAEKLDVKGPFDVECLFDEENGKIYFIELNNRFGGATAKAFACGYDEPYYALKSYGVDCGTPRKMRKVVVASRQAAFKCILATLGQNLTPFDYPDESKYRRIVFLMHAFMTHYDDVFSFHDLRGSLSLYSNNLKNKVGRS